MPSESYQKIVAAINADNTGEALKWLLATEPELDVNDTCTSIVVKDDSHFETTKTALGYLVSKAGKTEHLRILLERGAKAKYVSPEGNTALYFALRDYNPDTTNYCKSLLDAGASMGEVGVTPAHIFGADALQLINYFHREYVPGRGIQITPAGQALHVFIELYTRPRVNMEVLCKMNS